MLLFFFMVATVMRESGEKKLYISLPSADQVKKIEKKALVTYIYVGTPTEKYQAKRGTEPTIQLNDDFASLDKVGPYVLAFKATKRDEEKPFVKTSIKADSDVGMGIITDIKEELRKVNALKVNYSTKKGSVLTNFEK
jgi:biopolymer transport protein ExbD